MRARLRQPLLKAHGAPWLGRGDSTRAPWGAPPGGARTGIYGQADLHPSRKARLPAWNAWSLSSVDGVVESPKACTQAPDLKS